jgi:hypothetical protein
LITIPLLIRIRQAGVLQEEGQESGDQVHQGRDCEEGRSVQESYCARSYWRARGQSISPSGQEKAGYRPPHHPRQIAQGWWSI